MSSTTESMPYAEGIELRIREHVPPKPFGGWYGPTPRPAAQVWYDGMPVMRLPFALDYPPLETEPPSAEEHTFTITGTKTLRRHFESEGGGAHVLTGYFDGNETAVCLAKIYDGLYYPLNDRDFYEWDCMMLADFDYAVEAWAYLTMQPVATVAAKLVPKYFGAWTFQVDTDQPGCRRWVRMLLLELVPGETVLDKICRATKDGAVQYSLLPQEELRLHVLKTLLEAEITIWWDAEVEHSDLEPRNIIVRDDGSVVVLDFNQAVIYRFREHGPHPKYEDDEDELPPSPIERYWVFAPGGNKFADTKECGGPWADWVPQGWLKDKELAALWLLETWGSTPPGKYMPLSDYFLNHPAHVCRSKGVLEMLEKLGRKPAEKS